MVAAIGTIVLHHPRIDALHQELDGLLGQLDSIPASRLVTACADIIDHTERHFAEEEALMQASGLPHADEHCLEHRQILQSLRQFQHRPSPLLRAFLTQGLPERLTLHVTRMDSMLAAHLQQITHD